MPIDASILLGAKGIELPNPLALAQQGLTLGDLANKNMLGQLQVKQAQQTQDLYSDPQYLSQFVNMLNPGGDPQQSAALMDTLQKNPLAAASVIKGLLEMQKEVATRDKTKMDTEKTSLEMQEIGGKRLANTAFGFINEPSAQGFDSVLRQLDFMQNHHGVKPSDYGVNVADLTSGDPQKIFGSLQQLAGLTTDPDKRATIAKMSGEQVIAKQKLILDALKLNEPKVETSPLTGKVVVTTPYAPGQAPSGTVTTAPIPGFGGPPPGSQPGQGTPMQAPVVGQPAPPAVANMQVEAPQSPRPEDQIAFLQKQLEEAKPEQKPAIQAQINALAKPVTSSAQVRDTGVQIAPGAKQGELIKGAVGEYNNLQASAQAAPQIQALVDELRKKEAMGVYSGGIQGTDFFKTLASRLAAAGLVGPEGVEKIGNTQAWEADTGNLVAQAIKAWVGAGGRVAAREIDYFKNLKPNLLQTEGGRQQIYRELYDMSGRQQQHAQQAGEWLQSHDDLSGFVPKFTSTKMKPVVFEDLPSPAGFKEGATVRGDKGTFQIKNGAWELVGPPAAAMSAQVPR
jgi:hypothetical protein